MVLRILAWVAAGVIAVIALSVVVLLLFREELTALYLKPAESFEEMPAPAAPDYEAPEAWAAKPGRADTADLAPPGMPPAVSDDVARVDVFYVHPTTYYSSGGWNAAPGEPESRRLVDTAVMPLQAGAFNLAGRVFAPRYRQATLYSFMEPWDDMEDPQGPKALEMAYEDVARAFETYIRLFNNGRPFILAGHSQGSLHLLRLMQEYMTRPELKRRLVAAYVVGMSVPTSLFEGPLAHVPPCAEPDQTGCLASWNTFGPGGDPATWFEQTRIWENGELVPVAGRALNCTNPLTWRTDGEAADPDLHRGAVPFPEADDEQTTVARLPEARMLDFAVQCRDGILFMEAEPPGEFGELVFAANDYHIYDYNLFYGAIRENAALRAAAWLALN